MDRSNHFSTILNFMNICLAFVAFVHAHKLIGIVVSTNTQQRCECLQIRVNMFMPFPLYRL